VLERPAVGCPAEPVGVGPAVLALRCMLAASGFVLLYLAAVATRAGQVLDDAAMHALSELVEPRQWAGLVLHWVSAGSLLGLSAALGLVTWVLRGRGVALLGALTTGVVVLSAQSLKLLLQRPELAAGPATNSFPSGHVAVVAGLAAAVVVGAGPGVARRVALVLLTPVVGLAGLATVVLQWHRPSDVLGSVLLSVAVSEPVLAPHPCDRVESGMQAGPRG
jgi:membrane-associated phospholipid phosphatase